MKRTMIALAAIALLQVWPAGAGDAVEPISTTFTNYRAQAVQTISSMGTIYKGQTLRLTNCVVMASTTATNTIQGLDAVTVDVAVGNSSTNIEYEATVTSTNNGTWTLDFDVPDLSAFFIQVKVTDANTNSYIYPNKNMTASESLFD